MIGLKIDPPPTSIIRCMEKLRKDLADKALSAGLTAAAKPLKAAMRSTAPQMRKYIGQRQLSGTARARLGLGQYQKAILVGATRRVAGGRSAGMKAIWLEWGTRPHEIRPRAPQPRGVLRFAGIFAEKIDHPGVRPRYWMERANRMTGSAQAQQFYIGMARYLNRKKIC